MKVFISWSGDHSKQIGEAIHWWLPHVLQFADPYFTPADIDKGARWSNEISKHLEQSNICIIAMTQECLNSSWIMFEAGAISRMVGEGRVCPIVFGIDKTDLVMGPLSSFQATEFNRDEIRQLLGTINNAAEVPLSETKLEEAFNKWWPDLEEKIKAISSTAQPPRPRRSDRELLEENVELTKTLVREQRRLIQTLRAAKQQKAE